MAMNNSVEKLATELGQLLLAKGWRVTCAESCTGGGVAQAITAVPGSSRWFETGFITYSNGAKQQQLGVSEDTLANHGAVSEAVVLEMAAGALASAGADIAVAVSGIAGPDGGTPEKPVGTVLFAWQCRDAVGMAREQHFAGDRQQVREQSVICALQGLIQLLD